MGAARRAIVEHGEGTAYWALFADAPEELGQRTGLAHDVADREAAIHEALTAELGRIDGQGR